MLNSYFLFDTLFWVYLIASCCYIFYLVLRKEIAGHIAFALTIIGWLINCGALAARMLETGRAPYANLYETMILLSWLIVACYIVIELKFFRIRVLGAVIVSMAFLAIGAAAMLPYRYQAAEPLIPALQSNWLILHVITTFVGYAGFAVAFGFGVIYLFKERAKKRTVHHSLTGFPVQNFLMTSVTDL